MQSCWALQLCTKSDISGDEVCIQYMTVNGVIYRATPLLSMYISARMPAMSARLRVYLHSSRGHVT